MPESFVASSGLATLVGEKAGSGPSVVFLHAGVADRRMWRAQMGAFPGFTTVAYDRRGFGETLHVDEAYAQVGDLRAILDVTAPRESAVLVGCSQGGRIAVDAALAMPQRVRGLVLVAPAISGAPQPTDLAPAIRAWIERVEAAEAAADVERINALEAHAWLDGPLQPEGRVGGPARELFLDMNELALRAEARGTETAPPAAYNRLPEIAAPTLVIFGDLDFPHICANCEHAASQIPRAQVTRLRGAAHLPNLEDGPGFNAVLAEFLRSLPQ